MGRKRYRHHRQPQRKKGKKIRVSSSFQKAVTQLKRMKGNRRRLALAHANDKFIRHLSNTVGKIRHSPPVALMTKNPRLWRRIQFQRKALQSFANRKTSIKTKRKIVKQKSGIIPALIPLICAGITAAGGVASAGVGAAIAKA